MTNWLLDTDIISAFAPGQPAVSSQLTAWFEDRTDDLFLSAITVAEIEAGVAKLRRTGADRRADELNRWFERLLSLYADRVLPFDLAAARIAGALGESARADGRYPGFADVAIAAIARSRRLEIPTLKLRRFAPLGVAARNPFAAE